MATAWILLLLAGFFEILMAMGLKYSNGFTQFWASASTFVAGAISFFLLSLSLKELPIGIAYAVWTGIGAAGTAIIGMILLGESANALKILCLLFITLGVIGLKYAA